MSFGPALPAGESYLISFVSPTARNSRFHTSHRHIFLILCIKLAYDETWFSKWTPVSKLGKMLLIGRKWGNKGSILKKSLMPGMSRYILHVFVFLPNGCIEQKLDYWSRMSHKRDQRTSKCQILGRDGKGYSTLNWFAYRNHRVMKNIVMNLRRQRRFRGSDQWIVVVANLIGSKVD